MGEAIRQGGVGRAPLYDLLLIDPSVPADFNLSSLPLTNYFPYPFGGMTARTGWDKGSTSDVAMADMKIVERQFNNHEHLDAGSFQLYYKGPLAVETGVYEGVEGAYGSDHFINYYQRTIAHNCMLVFNPDEKFTWHRRPVANDGGQRWPGGASEPSVIDIVMSEEFKKGEVQAYDFGPCSVKPEYSYLKGDITRAYTDKVKNHQRSFVFLNMDNAQVPAVLIVYDYIVSSNKDFKKTWVMHCVPEPVFTGNVCTVTLVDNVKKYNGKLVNTVLLPLPQNINWEKIGGRRDNEYTVEGKNYPNHLRNENNSNDLAAWRIELSPKTPSETDVFLNVMQVTDAGNTKLLPIEKIETENLTGVQISDRIVLFAKNGALDNRPIHLNIKGNGVFKVLINDLEKGNWDITGPKSPGIVRNDQNLIYLNAVAGNYVITKK
jgi:heparin/heparan-sulfate lyase